MYTPVWPSSPINRSQGYALGYSAASLAWRSPYRAAFLALRSEFLHIADTTLPEILTPFLIPGYLDRPIFALMDAFSAFPRWGEEVMNTDRNFVKDPCSEWNE
jgi:hypothetical protein